MRAETFEKIFSSWKMFDFINRIMRGSARSAEPLSFVDGVVSAPSTGPYANFPAMKTSIEVRKINKQPCQNKYMKVFFSLSDICHARW